YELLAEELLHIEGKECETILYYFLAQKPAIGIEIAFNYINECLRNESWKLKDVEKMIECLGSINASALTTCTDYISDIQFICAYIGVFKAISYGYNSIVPLLFQTSL
ncbi:unnamed protein product, partial [Didymodactylos carnosus]